MTAPRDRARFVGRFDELVRVRSTITSSQTNGFELLVIGGERGIGKSRLVARALELEAARIDRIAHFSCIDQMGATDAFLDGFISRLAGTIYGSTETTFYVLAVYFGSVSVRQSRHAIVAGLTADTVAVIASVILCWLMFG